MPRKLLCIRLTENWPSLSPKLSNVFTDYCQLTNMFLISTNGQSFSWRKVRSVNTNRLILVLQDLISAMSSARKFCHEFPATLTTGCLGKLGLSKLTKDSSSLKVRSTYSRLLYGISLRTSCVRPYVMPRNALKTVS